MIFLFLYLKWNPYENNVAKSRRRPSVTRERRPHWAGVGVGKFLSTLTPAEITDSDRLQLRLRLRSPALKYAFYTCKSLKYILQKCILSIFLV